MKQRMIGFFSRLIMPFLIIGAYIGKAMGSMHSTTRVTLANGTTVNRISNIIPAGSPVSGLDLIGDACLGQTECYDASSVSGSNISAKVCCCTTRHASTVGQTSSEYYTFRSCQLLSGTCHAPIKGGPDSSGTCYRRTSNCPTNEKGQRDCSVEANILTVSVESISCEKCVNSTMGSSSWFPGLSVSDARQMFIGYPYGSIINTSTVNKITCVVSPGDPGINIPTEYSCSAMGCLAGQIPMGTNPSNYNFLKKYAAMKSENVSSLKSSFSNNYCTPCNAMDGYPNFGIANGTNVEAVPAGGSYVSSSLYGQSVRLYDKCHQYINDGIGNISCFLP
jgi:hypothetical protein